MSDEKKNELSDEAAQRIFDSAYYLSEKNGCTIDQALKAIEISEIRTAAIIQSPLSSIMNMIPKSTKRSCGNPNCKNHPKNKKE